MNEIHITEQRLATILNITPRYTRDLFANHRVRPGIYDLLKCLEVYAREANGKTEEMELNRVKTETARLKLDILKGNFIPKDEVELFFTDMISKVKSKLLGVASKIAPLVDVNTTKTEIEELINREIENILVELSEQEYEVKPSEVENGK